MADVVVTVPKNFKHPCAPGKKGLAAWLAEGDPPGSEWSGEEWCFSTYGVIPNIEPGERVYVVCEGRLVGYAPLISIWKPFNFSRRTPQRFGLVRGGGAVAVTIPQPIIGFRGWRYRWWDRSEEVPLEMNAPVMVAGPMLFAETANG